MRKFSLLAVIVLGAAALAFGQVAAQPNAPEIDPGQALSVLAFLSGAVTVIRSRRK